MEREVLLLGVPGRRGRVSPRGPMSKKVRVSVGSTALEIFLATADLGSGLEVPLLGLSRPEKRWEEEEKEGEEEEERERKEKGGAGRKATTKFPGNCSASKRAKLRSNPRTADSDDHRREACGHRSRRGRYEKRNV